MSGTLALAAHLAELDEQQLSALLASRLVVSPASVRDPLGLASQLLRADSLTRVLQTLDVESIQGLRTLATHGQGVDQHTLDALAQAGLVGSDRGTPTALSEATELLESLLAAAASSEASAVAVPTPTPSEIHARVGISPEAADKRSRSTARTTDLTSADPTRADPTSADPTSADWYSPALTSVRLATEFLRTLGEHPAVLSQRGAITSTALRELSTRLHCRPEVAQDLAAALRSAGLVGPLALHGRRRDTTVLCPTPLAPEWRQQELVDRWLALAEATLTELTSPLQWALTTPAQHAPDPTLTRLLQRYPLLPSAALVEAEALLHRMETLGVTLHGKLTPPSLQLLEGNRSGAASLTRAGLPPFAAGIYLQPDLSLIVPGPLPVEEERALSEIAEIEHIGVASTLRLSIASLQQALRFGFTVAEIRALLTRLSLTGIPQPLDFLLTDLQRSAVLGQTAPDPHSHYTAEIVPLLTGSSALPTTASGSAPGQVPPLGEELSAMIQRVHLAARSTPGEGDLMRRLELAIRNRAVVQVTAEASGKEHTFVLTPVALSGGRLRATDEAAGVQRTLPLTAIRAVEAF